MNFGNKLIKVFKILSGEFQQIVGAGVKYDADWEQEKDGISYFLATWAKWNTIVGNHYNFPCNQNNNQ